MSFRINKFSSRLLKAGSKASAETVAVKLFFLAILWTFAGWLYQLDYEVPAILFALASLPIAISTISTTFYLVRLFIDKRFSSKSEPE